MNKENNILIDLRLSANSDEEDKDLDRRVAAQIARGIGYSVIVKNSEGEVIVYPGDNPGSKEDIS